MGNLTARKRLPMIDLNRTRIMIEIRFPHKVHQRAEGWKSNGFKVLELVPISFSVITTGGKRCLYVELDSEQLRNLIHFFKEKKGVFERTLVQEIETEGVTFLIISFISDSQKKVVVSPAGFTSKLRKFLQNQEDKDCLYVCFGDGTGFVQIRRIHEMENWFEKR